MFYDNEIEILNRLIQHCRFKHKVLPFVRFKEPLRIITKPGNRTESQISSKLHTIRNEEVKVRIVSYISKIGDKDKLLTIDNILDSTRTILNDNGQWFALINANKLSQVKSDLLENTCISIRDRHKANVLFHLIYILETASLTSIYKEHNLQPYSLLEPKHYKEVATLTMRRYLDLNGKDYASLLFNYFYNEFTYNYEFLGHQLHDYRANLSKGLAYTLGAYLNSSASI